MDLPLIVEPEQLAASLDAENLLIVDLCNPLTPAQVPGAVRLEYAGLIARRIARRRPAPGGRAVEQRPVGRGPDKRASCSRLR